MGKVSLAEVRALAASIRAQQPAIGSKKLLATIKSTKPQWKLSNKQLRNALGDPKGQQQAAAEPGARNKRGVSAAFGAGAPAQKKQKHQLHRQHEDEEEGAPSLSQKKDGAADSLPSSFPYEIDEADHAETPLAAYEDVAPVLRGFAKCLSKTPAELKIWDPFYCTGKAAERLAAVGFPSVHHRCEDFQAIVAAGGSAIPDHDVLVTNPPYSAEHLQNLFEHCVSSGKAWALLLPWFVVRKPWFRAYTANGGADGDRVAFLVPRKRYFFQPPKAMIAVGREKVTAPFETFWYLYMGSSAAQQETLAGWRVEQAGILERALLEHDRELDAEDRRDEAGDSHPSPPAGTTRRRARDSADEIPAVAAALLDAAQSADAGENGQGSRCRLGVGFKKRRGTPGYHTLLDAKGLLIGRPVPTGWLA